MDDKARKFFEGIDSERDFTDDEIDKLMSQLQIKWRCSRRQVLRRLIGRTKPPRPRKPAPKKRAALIKKQKKARN